MFKFLQTIRSIKKLKEVKPSQAWLRNLRMQFSQQTTAKAYSQPFWRTGLAAALTVLVLIAGVGGGTINSAQAAFPGDRLYPIKLFVEKVQEALTIGEENKINLAIKLAEKRIAEAEQGPDEKENAKTVAQAEVKFQKAEVLLHKIAELERKEGKAFKNLEKTVERLEKLSERKNKLAVKFINKIPPVTSVTVVKESNKVIVTFTTATSTFATSTRATSTPAKKEVNPGTRRIIELLTDGAGKSEKVPEGLLKAQGIRKKLDGRFQFPTATSTPIATSTPATTTGPSN